jgi:TPR repeat protein/serine/threonine protein phosphatase PrpC
MQIVLHPPFALHESGGGSNNEDCIFPAKGTATVRNTFFLVCDGVGGQENGEVASRIVCDSFASFLGTVDTDAFDETVFRQALDYACRNLDAEGASTGTQKMGTTLTFICFHRKGVFMAHVGDSRIYHLRKQNGHTGILYRSVDHSYVNELVRARIITPEEAVTHPKRNIITRALQPGLKQPVMAEIHETEDVEAGDYFFLCSDGILEQVNDALLCDVIARDTDNRAKTEAIHAACRGRSHDNFSAYLIPVADVTDRSTGAMEEKNLIFANESIKKPTIMGRIKKYLTIAGLILLCTGTANAQSRMEQGDTLVAQGNYEAAAQMYSLCMESDKQCLYKLFRLIFDEKIKPDYGSQLYDLIKPLALDGDAVAEYWLGYLYRAGIGITQNYEEAVKWYRKSAEQGDAGAQNNLGVIYAKGLGVTQDYTEAVKWYRKSAEQGYARAQSNLGYCYYCGYGVTQDYTEAVKWYRKSAEQGDATGQSGLGRCYCYGYGVTQDYTEAIKWFRKSAEQGDTNGQNYLGWMYENGYGVTQDYEEAVKWYRKCAEQGSTAAQNNLGIMYRDGKGVTQDYGEAIKWHRKSAEQGYAEAQANLGYMYDEGYGVTQDYAEAVKWFRKSAEQGNARAQANLGYMYDKGYGVTQDYAEAVKWFRKSAEQGNAGAQFNLGVMYNNGHGVPASREKAIEWYRKAAAQGHETAINNLKELGVTY